MTATSTVTAGLEFLRSLPNFQNIKVIVQVSDTPRLNESTNDAFERVYGFCEKKLLEKVAQIEQELT